MRIRVGFALLVISAVLATVAHAGRLSATARQQVDAALEILEAYEEHCGDKLHEGFSPNMTIAACLKKIWTEHRNIRCLGRDAPEGAMGRKTLDDRSANCTGSDIIEVKHFGRRKTDTNFVKLLITLWHEATHALQDLTDMTTSNYADKVTGPLEVQAFTNHKNFARCFQHALEKLYANIRDDVEPRTKGMNECERALVACYLKETNWRRIRSMARRAEGIFERSCETIDGITRWLERNCPPARPAEGSPRNSSAESTGGPRWVDAVPSDGDAHQLEEPDETSDEPLGSFFLPTGLTEVLGLRFQTDLDGTDHLIVSGHRDGTGIIQFWIDETPGIIDPLVFVSELDVDAHAGAPSGLVPFGPAGGTGGGLLVWDETTSSMRALVDTDGDTVADSIDPTQRFRLPIDASEYVRLELVHANEYRLSSFAIGSMSGNVPVITVLDHDGNGIFDDPDGFFEAAPLDDPRRIPSLASSPLAGLASIVASGPIGHALELWEADATGAPLAPISVVGSVGSSNEVVLDLLVPLVVGMYVAVLDIDNAELSDATEVLPAAPSSNRAFGNRSPGAGGALVFQRGDYFDGLDIVDVLVGGESALSFLPVSGGIEYTTPPNVPVKGDGISDHGHVADVKILHLVKSQLVELGAQAVAYDDPNLTGEYECRKGNVNVGKGEVSDVLFANGGTGIGNARRVFVDRDDPFTMLLQAPPSNPSGPAPFAMYVWVNEPTEGSVSPLPKQTGTICRRIPLIGGGGQPKRIANNTGVAPLGVENWPGGPTKPAPTSLLALAGGLRKIGTFTFQGIILDEAAPNGRAAITNALVVISE